MPSKRIPALLGLFLIIAATSISVYLVENGSPLSGKAKTAAAPQSVRFTNIGADQFTVSWLTPEAATGFVKYGSSPSSLKLLALDDRDQDNSQPQNYFLHHVTVSSLQPQQEYYFKIGSNKDLFTDFGQPFSVKTAPVLENPPLADPAYGKVTQADGQPAVGVLVYLEAANAQSLSCLTNDSGYWMISKNLARTTDSSTWVQPHSGTLRIFVQAGPEGVATLSLSPDSDNPAPEISLNSLNSSQPLPRASSREKTAFSSQIKILAPQGYVLPAFSASPSGELSPTPTVKPTPTPTSVRPSPSLSPSPTSSTSPTPIPTATVPESGHWLSSVIILLSGLLLILGGVVLVKI